MGQQWGGGIEDSSFPYSFNLNLVVHDYSGNNLGALRLDYNTVVYSTFPKFRRTAKQPINFFPIRR